MILRIFNLVRYIFQKLLNRDILVINNNSKVIRIPGSIIVLQSEDGLRYLPVSYNYHTPRDWLLHYEISGNSTGTLCYSIYAPDKPPFCKITTNVNLPFTWIVKLEDHNLTGNGTSLEIIGDLPVDTLLLVAEFEYISNNSKSFRRVGHRVKLDDGAQDEEYFCQNVYKSYEKQSSHYPPEILSKIEKYHPLSGRLLDIGCATGLLVQYAISKGLAAEGIDISSWAVQKANEKVRGQCKVLDFNKACASDFINRYHIITLNSVLEHLEDPESSLNLLYDLCQPRGVVYIQTLNADSLMRQILKNDWGGFTDYTHKSPWISATWLIETARSIGFEIAYINKYHVWNDNIYDDVWMAFSSILKIYPINTLLEEQYGDIVEIILRRL